MSTRERIAAQAMAALIQVDWVDERVDGLRRHGVSVQRAVAKIAVDFADELIEELKTPRRPTRDRVREHLAYYLALIERGNYGNGERIGKEGMRSIACSALTDAGIELGAALAGSTLPPKDTACADTAPRTTPPTNPEEE